MDEGALGRQDGADGSGWSGTAQLEIYPLKKGDWCLLNHYEDDSLFGLWQAEKEGSKQRAT